MPDYFTLDELRALPQMSDVATYTDDRCEAAADYVEATIERVVGTSFVPRTVTGEVHDGGVYGLVLDSAHVLSVTSATNAGVLLSGLTYRVKAGVVQSVASGAFSPSLWPSGCGNLAVTYQAGYSATPPADIKEAALKATRAHLISTNSNAAIVDRQTSITTEMGTVSFVVAGSERPFGYPEVDAVILGWRDKINAFGFA